MCELRSTTDRLNSRFVYVFEFSSVARFRLVGEEYSQQFVAHHLLELSDVCDVLADPCT